MSIQLRADNGELQHSIPSPSFGVMYPELYGRELMPEATFTLLNGVWNRQFFPPSTINFYRLRDVIVAFEGLVFDRDLLLYPLTRTGHSDLEVEQSVAASKLLLDASAVERVKGPVVLCKKRGTYNYGHFLMEMLPKAYFTRHLFSGETLSYMISEEPNPMSDIMTQAFDLLRIPNEALCRVNREPVLVDELIVVDGLTTHGSFMSPLVIDCMDYIGRDIPAGNERRIHVSRRSAYNRKLNNEADLTPLLAANNFISIDPSTLSLREQISIFKGASQVIGVIGAGLTNICFSSQQCQVTAFVPATMPDTFFWFIANLKRQCFREVRLPEVGGKVEGWPTWSGNLVVEQSDLPKWLSLSPSWLSLLQRPGTSDQETTVALAIRQKMQAQFVGPTYAASVFT